MVLTTKGIRKDKIGSGFEDSMEVFLYRYTIFIFRYLILM